MRQLSRTDAPALRALACLCLSDPSNPTNPGYGVTARDVGTFLWPDLPSSDFESHARLRSLAADGYVRQRGDSARATWTPTARGWQAALMPAEIVDSKC